MADPSCKLQLLLLCVFIRLHPVQSKTKRHTTMSQAAMILLVSSINSHVVLPKKSCEWPAKPPPAGIEWAPDLVERYISQSQSNIDTTLSSHQFCQEVMDSPPIVKHSMPTPAACVVFAAHHKSGTHLSRKLRDMLFSKHRVKHLSLTSLVMYRKAAATGCSFVHFVRSPISMVKSQHVYQGSLWLANETVRIDHGVHIKDADGMPRDHAYFKALQAGDWSGMWKGTLQYMWPKVDQMLSIVDASLHQHNGCDLNLDCDGDFGAQYDATIVRLLLHVFPNIHPDHAHTICRLRIDAVGADASRVGSAADGRQRNGGDHIASTSTSEIRTREFASFMALQTEEGGKVVEQEQRWVRLWTALGGQNW
jgi:hypothetical protein